MNVTAKPKVFLALTLLLYACSSASPSAKSPLEAIEHIQALAGYQKSTVTFIETTKMINSPNGDLMVDMYQDEDGRKFYVDSKTNTVVEIDARDLSNIHYAENSSNEVFSAAELETRVKEFVHAAIPDFQVWKRT